MAEISYRPNDEIGIRGINSEDLLKSFHQFVKNGYHYKPYSHARLNPLLPVQTLTMTKTGDTVKVSQSVTVEGTGNIRTIMSYNAEDFLGTVESLFNEGFILYQAPIMHHGRYSATVIKEGAAEVHPEPLHKPEPVVEQADIPVVSEDTPVEMPDEIELFDMNKAQGMTTKEELYDYALKFNFKLDKRKSLEAMKKQLEPMVS